MLLVGESDMQHPVTRHQRQFMPLIGQVSTIPYNCKPMESDILMRPDSMATYSSCDESERTSHIVKNR